MSHSVAIKTQIKDISCLLSQFEARNWQIKDNAKCRTYPSDPAREKVHTFVAVNPATSGPHIFDIGLNEQQDGTWSFTYDPYGGSIHNQLGNDLSQIKQGYAVDLVKRQLAMSGEYYNYTEQVLADGTIHLTATAN